VYAKKVQIITGTERKIKQLHTLISTRSGSKKKSTQQKVKKSMHILIERLETVWVKGHSISEILTKEYCIRVTLKKIAVTISFARWTNEAILILGYFLAFIWV
jgi:hypothetical protein